MARKKRVEKVEVIPESEVVESVASEVVPEVVESSDAQDTPVSDVPIPLSESTESAVTESDAVCEVPSSTEAVHPEVPEEKPFRLAKLPSEYLTVEDVEPPRKKPRMNSMKSRKETVSDTSEDQVVDTPSEPEEVGVPSGVSEIPEPDNKPLRIASMTEEQRQALESDEWFRKNARKANESRGAGAGVSKAVLKDSMKAFDAMSKRDEAADDRGDLVASDDADSDYLMLHRHGLEDEPDENGLEDDVSDVPDDEVPQDSEPDDSPDDGPDDDASHTNLFMRCDCPSVKDLIDGSGDGDTQDLICRGLRDIPFLVESEEPQYVNIDSDKHDVMFTTREQKHVITEMPHYVFDGIVLGCSSSPLDGNGKESSLRDYVVFTNRGVYSFYASDEVGSHLDVATQDQLQEGFEQVLNTLPVCGLEFFPVEDMDGYHEIEEDIEGVDVPCVGVLQLGDLLYGQDMSMPIRFNVFVTVIVSLLNARDFESSDLSFLTAYFRAL
jgi:hypothetical protein